MSIKIVGIIHARRKKKRECVNATKQRDIADATLPMLRGGLIVLALVNISANIARDLRLRKPYTDAQRLKRAAQLRTWKRLHLEQVRDHRHRRRALELGVVSFDCRQKIVLLLGERFCHWCCTRLIDANRAIDHIVALARGGLHEPDNLCAACKRCNQSKGNQFVHDWLPTLEARSL